MNKTMKIKKTNTHQREHLKELTKWEQSD